VAVRTKQSVARASKEAAARPRASPVVTLRQILVERFSLEELRDLCMDLQIDHESLPHNTKTALVRELVTYCQRRERVTELSAMVQRLRPDISW